MKLFGKRKENETEKWPALISSVIILLAALLLLVSFCSTSLPTSTETFNDTDSLPNEIPRLVFVVIDAWRLTFLTSDASPMKFIRDSISNKDAFLFNTYARMPTVTLPRITSYITGTLPSFGTILTNFATDKINIDNWVERLNTNNKTIHFYGDDTWLKILPNQYKKYEGTTSFFVYDYTEVDHNVTRHLNEELNDENWDVLILHYLGLDHIGHSLGGTSDKIEGKLKEMDNVLERIYTKLKKENEKNNRETMIVVCGDHGMTLGGSHGGASIDESRVPLVIWKIEKNEMNQNGKQYPDIVENIEQIDMSATIFDYFGLKTTGYGISFLHKITKENITPDYWKKQYDHFRKLANDNGIPIKLSCDDDENMCDFSTKAIQNSLEEEMRRIQSKIIEKSSDIPNVQLMISVLFFLIAAAVSSFGWINVEREDGKWNIPFLFIHIFCFSSSFIEEEHEIWYFIGSVVLIYECLKYGKAQMKENKSVITREVLELLGIVILHRIGFGWTQGFRRRWSMDESILPKSLFFELFDWKMVDLNTLLSSYPLVSLIPSSICWILSMDSPISKLVISAPLLSHALRIYGISQIDAYSMTLFRIAVLPFSYYKNCLSTGIISLVLVVVPVSQIPLIFIIYLMSKCLKKYNLNYWKLVVIFYSTFYYTGNSNSVATLSLNAAYYGLLDHYPVLVGIQLLLNTSAGPIVFLCAWSTTNSWKQSTDKLAIYFLTFRIMSAVTSIICLYIFQHHLFVWSVYTPKVFYDVFQCLFAIGVNLYSFIC